MRPTAHNQPDPGHVLPQQYQHDRYSWVPTPVLMSRQRFGEDNVPPVPALPASVQNEVKHQSPAAASTAYDFSVDSPTVGRDAVSQMNLITSSLPPKSDPAFSHEPTPKKPPVAPDENPLTPSPTQRSRSNTYQYPPHSAPTPGSLAHEYHRPGQALHPNQQIKGGTWRHGLWDCGDVGVCCTGLFCPCILYGKTQHRLSLRSERKDPTNMLGYEVLNGSCAAFAVLCGCSGILAAIQHTRVRKAYDIPGGVGSDCVRAVCCCCCTLAQDEKEIRFREGQASRGAGPVLGAQYTAPSMMSYPAPPS